MQKDVKNANHQHHQARSLLDLCANFPERCPACGEVHQTLLNHHKAKQPEHPFEIPAPGSKSEKHAFETSIKCGCGHETRVLTQERRDNSEAGKKQRKQFDEMLAILLARGIKKSQAKDELRKNIRGENSELVNRIFSRKEK